MPSSAVRRREERERLLADKAYEEEGSAMRRLGLVVLTASVLATGLPSSDGRGWTAAASPAPPRATLVLGDITHSLQDRTLVISGWVRNTGGLPVSGLVIDASGFAPNGDLAGFSSDGVPWVMRPDTVEHFNIFLPLGKALVSTYTISVTASRPRQDRPAMVTRAIFPRFYRPLILPRVRVKVSAESYSLTFTASAEDLPVTAVEVSVQLLVDELKGALPDFRVLTVEVPVDRPMRMRFAPLILKVVSVNVLDAVLAPSWTVP